MKLSELLRTAVEKDATDLYLIPKSPPMIRMNDEIVPVIETPLTSVEIQQVAEFMMNEEQKDEFYQNSEVNFAYEREGAGRFRVNIFKSHSGVSLVCRIVKLRIPSFEELLLPPVLQDLAMENRGLILVVGAVGSGKSSTLAAMIGHRNENRGGHILTIEDPLEFLHTHKRSVVSQREIGIDTESYSVALKNALRQAPDVIVIGEVRDTEAMSSAVHFAETGHLVMSTLHAVNAPQTIERIINFYPNEFRQNILLQLSMNLKAVVSQRLIPKADGTGQIVAVGVMRDTPRIKDLIAKEEIESIAAAVEERNREGICSIDQAIFNLYEQGSITAEDALRFADSANNMGIRIRHFENTLKQRQEANRIRQPRRDDKYSFVRGEN
jgi:twitching motility protein PilU